jgi:MFS family permease
VESGYEASKRLLPWLVAVAFFMESLDTTILNTAVPAISAALHVTPLSMKAVLASYTLSLAVSFRLAGGLRTGLERGGSLPLRSGCLRLGHFLRYI